ncbi:hypothetical protein CONPUDRAFT_43986, partial [Coniophora puteana RWD-64-598 SS2]
RYRQIPRFGRTTIRRFRKNSTAMKKMAARDFEDLLQCALPVFGGVFPSRTHNKVVLDLLFELGKWHSLAKLRLHTDDTLKLLEQATISLGASARKFQAEVCPSYDTREIPSETSARGRRAVTKIANSKGKARATNVAQSSKRKVLNLDTYKYHSLGDTVKSIRHYGTMDNYSSLLVFLFAMHATYITDSGLCSANLLIVFPKDAIHGLGKNTITCSPP